jgi:hypothetical protein
VLVHEGLAPRAFTVSTVKIRPQQALICNHFPASIVRELLAVVRYRFTMPMRGSNFRSIASPPVDSLCRNFILIIQEEKSERSLVMSQCTKLLHQQHLERRNVIAKLIYGEFAEKSTTATWHGLISYQAAPTVESQDCQMKPLNRLIKSHPSAAHAGLVVQLTLAR